MRKRRHNLSGVVLTNMRGVRTRWQAMARRRLSRVMVTGARMAVIEGKWIALHRARRKPARKEAT